MLPPLRRYLVFSFFAILFFVALFHTLAEPPHGHHHHHGSSHTHGRRPKPIDEVLHPGFLKPKFRWRNVQQKHPVQSYAKLPKGSSVRIPQIQYEFPPEPSAHAAQRRNRLRAVEAAMSHSWEGYKRNAWLQDEVSPLTGNFRNPFGSWGATLVDSLDTLWIMGMKQEFTYAVSALNKIDFVSTDLTEINVFETTIRYLGGLLSAYDVSGHKYSTLLEKATELGDMLYLAFDTPNRMPVTHWNWQNTALGKDQEAKKFSLVAEVGSLSLEFTRLTQLTGDPKFYDAVARVSDVFEQQQNETKLPGLWPVNIDAKNANFKKDSTFTFGGMADSMYEYLPKEHIMLGGHTDQYKTMYQAALATAKEQMFFRPLTPENRKMLISGTVKRFSTHNIMQPQGEHLTCFAGGMVALAAKIFAQPQELETARELVDGCIWAYESMPTGIMPEIFTALPCESTKLENCTWNEDAWLRAVAEKANSRGSGDLQYAARAQQVIQKKSLAPGFTDIKDARYILRPEAIESVFVLYRITGDPALQDKAWDMFQAIVSHTRTDIAFAALKDVTSKVPELVDNMESFWTAETLKYFYLIFSEPNVISLDDYVLNTEAHPLLRPK